MDPSKSLYFKTTMGIKFIFSSLFIYFFRTCHLWFLASLVYFIGYFGVDWNLTSFYWFIMGHGPYGPRKLPFFSFPLIHASYLDSLGQFGVLMFRSWNFMALLRIIWKLYPFKYHVDLDMKLRDLDLMN